MIPSATCRRPRVGGVAVGLLVTLGLIPSRAAAQQQCAGLTAEALYQQGRELRERNRDDEALEVFQRAFDCFHEPRGHARVAITHAALSHWLIAEQELTRVLGYTDDGWINQNRAQITAMLQLVKSHIGLLEVRCNAPGARLRIFNGLTYPLPLREPIHLAITQRELEIEVVAPDRRTERRSVSLTPGAERVTTVVVDLEPLTPPATPPPAERIDAEDPGPGAWPWVATSLGAAGVLAGVIVLAGPMSAERAYFRQACAGPCPPDAYALASDAADRADAFQTLGWSLISGGAVATVCGLGWVLNERLRRRPSAARVPPVSFAVGLDGTVQVRGVF